jgi:hypothetical protein
MYFVAAYKLGPKGFRPDKYTASYRLVTLEIQKVS